MYNLEKIRLTNYLLWEDMEFEFLPGISHLFGKNRSGKSLIASALPSALYDVDLVPQNSRATVTMVNGKTEYDFSVFNQTGKRNKFEVAINGRSQKTETTNAARSIIDEHLCNNIQYGLFETTVSVSGLTTHPLAKKGAKTAQRLDWIHETLAYASILDSYLDDVEKLIKSKRDDSVKFGLLSGQLSKLEPIEKPTENSDDIRTELEQYRVKIRDLEDKQRLLTEAINHTEKQIEKPEMSLEKAEKLYAGVKALVKFYNDLKPLYDSYDEDIAKYNEVMEKKESYKSTYKNLCTKLDRKAINPKDAVDEIEEELNKLQQNIKAAYANNSVYESQTEQRELANSGVIYRWDEVGYNRRIADLKDRITITSAQIKAAASGKRNCPLCGSKTPHEHDIEQIKVENKKCKKRLAEYETELSVYLAKQVEYVKFVNIDKLEAKVGKLKQLLAAAQNYLKYNIKLQKPEKVEYDADKHKNAKAKVEKFNSMIIDIKAFNKAKASKTVTDNPYVGNFKADNMVELSNVERKLRTLYAKQTGLTDKRVNLETSVALYRRYREDRVRIIEEAKPLKQANSDTRLLAIAKKALGRDGFRSKRLESTLELFVNNLNEFAPLIWDEPFKFEIETGPRKCDVIVHRNKKAGTTTTLSGSEQRCWQLLCAISMLRLLPDNRRCNTIILDELEANMDTNSRHKMMQDFLPELQKTVDNILVISPLTKKELGFTPERTYMVEKRSGKSRLLTM